jgi:DNA-binding transcriptional ArsR family regulator
MSRRREGGRLLLPPPAAVFAALGDQRRLDLVAKLSQGESRSIAELSVGARITRQAVTKHLRVLQSAGLVSAERRGREMRFQFEAAPLDDAKVFLDRVSAHWDQALARLKAFVEAS